MLTSDVSWSQSGGYVQLSGSGMYRKATITQYTPYCIVTVRKIPVEKVSIPTNINVEAGKTAHISLKLTPANGTVSTTVWQNTNPSVATINANGTIQAIRPGTTSISCIVNGNVYSNTTKVTVTPATLQLTADPEGGFLAAGTAVTLKASDPDAEIYYTTDGSDPTKTSSRYTEPIVINHSLTLKAQAMHTDYYPSKVLTCSFKTTSLNIILTDLIAPY